MLPIEDCNDCAPAHLHKSPLETRAIFSTLPFGATFALVTVIAYRKVFPLLLNQTPRHNGSKLPAPVTATPEPSSQVIARRFAALTFSSTIALSTVLTELLLCEISNSFNPTARSVALRITVASLLGLLVVAIPLLGISSVVSKSGYQFSAEHRGRRRLAWALEFAGYAIFLIGFWCLGVLLPHNRTIQDTLREHNTLFQACLDRLGITGVSLMALLSGFASVSAVWQNFGPKQQLVLDTDVYRKQMGLDATLDMITEKKERLRNLDSKVADAPSKGFWARTVGTFRGGTDLQERQNLEMEIAGLETMSSSLETTLTVMRQRRTDQQRATTRLGRFLVAFSYIFSFYCIYRIIMTVVNIARRTFSVHQQKSDTDPITYGIALVARYIYPSLDQASWAQQISFLLSGVMLLASFSAVTQTFHLFSRFMPSILHATKTNFALFISQISGMYVISSALMLRGMMPKEVGGVINSALGAGSLEPAWVQRWFDGFFMSAVLVTAVGIWAGRQLGAIGAVEDELGWDRGVELGKRS